MRLICTFILSLALLATLGCVKPENVFTEDEAYKVVTEKWKEIHEICLDKKIEYDIDASFEINDLIHKGQGLKSTADMEIRALDQRTELAKFRFKIDLDWDDRGNYTITKMKVTKPSILVIPGV